MLHLNSALSFTLILIGIGVLFSNPTSDKNKLYFLICISGAVWSFSNYLSIYSDDPILKLNAAKSITPSSLTGMYLLYILIERLTETKQKFLDSNRQRMYALLSTLTVASSFTDLNVSKVLSSGEYQLGAIHLIYAPLMLVLFFECIKGLTHQVRIENNPRSKLILYSILGSVAPAIFIGLIMPFLGYYGAWNYTHYCIVLFILISLPAIIKGENIKINKYGLNILMVLAIIYLIAIIFLKPLTAQLGYSYLLIPIISALVWLLHVFYLNQSEVNFDANFNNILESVAQRNNISIVYEFLDLDDSDSLILDTLIFNENEYPNSYTFISKTHDKNYIQIVFSLRRRFKPLSNSRMTVLERDLQLATKLLSFNTTLRSLNSRIVELNEKNKILEKNRSHIVDILRITSHQLTPRLSAVKGFIELFQTSKNIIDDRLLNLSISSVTRAEETLSSIANVTDIELGKMTINKSQIVNLCDLIKEEINYLVNAKLVKKDRLIFTALDELIIPGDITKLREALSCIIRNSILYSCKDQPINMGLIKEENNVIFSIADHSETAGEINLNKFIRKYYRSTYARKANPNGSGIGLYFANKVIEMHGGTLVQDRSYLDGLKIYIKLPTH